MNKKWIYLLIVVIAGFVGFYFYDRYHSAPAMNFNKLILSDLQDQPVKWESFKGKKMLVSFGASWCPNCLDEMKELNDIKEVTLKDVEIIIISDEPLEKIMSLKERTDYPFTFLKMKQDFNSIGIFSIPTSYIVNTKLEIKKETVGYLDWKDPETAEHLVNLMN